MTINDGGVSTEDRIPALSTERLAGYGNRSYEEYLDSVDMITSAGCPGRNFRLSVIIIYLRPISQYHAPIR